MAKATDLEGREQVSRRRRPQRRRPRRSPRRKLRRRNREEGCEEEVAHLSSLIQARASTARAFFFSAFAVAASQYASDRISISRDAVRANSKALRSIPSLPELVGLRLRRDDEADVLVVERVDQIDQPLRFVAARRREDRNVGEDDRVEGLGDLQIVARAKRARAEIVEGEARDAVRRLAARRSAGPCSRSPPLAPRAPRKNAGNARRGRPPPRVRAASRSGAPCRCRRAGSRAAHRDGRPPCAPSGAR